LVLPLSAVCERVVGVDISDSMLAKAGEHLARAGRSNVELVKPAALARLAPVQLIHSTIVLQHIHPKRGMVIVGQLLDVLEPGGCGSLQFHLRGDGGRTVRLSRKALEESQLLNQLAVKVLRRPSREALALMHPYDLTAILRLLGSAGISEVHLETVTRPAGYVDATLSFRKPG